MKKKIENRFIGKYCMVRTCSAGVFAGKVSKLKGKKALVKKARRIYYWDGASSLSQLAQSGTSKPENCKFPCEVGEVYLSNVVEIIPITEEAKASIKKVVVWEQ